MKNSNTPKSMKGLSLFIFLVLTFFIGPMCIFAVLSEKIYYLLLILPLVLWSKKIIIENLKSKTGTKLNFILLCNLLFGFATGVFWIYLWIFIVPFLLFICIAEIFILGLCGEYQLQISQKLDEKKASWSNTKK